MSRALISLGSNLGDRQQTLDAAIAELDAEPNLRVTASSRWYATAPIGGPAEQGEFLNGAVTLETALTPLELLRVLEKKEKKFGRQRVIRWAERPLDLDLLLFADQVLATPQLTLPHPRMTFRRFVLEPAAEIAGEWQLPGNNFTIEMLLANIDRRPHSVVIVGGSDEQRETLAKKLIASRDELMVTCVEQLEPSSPNPSTLLMVLDEYSSPLTNLPAVLRLDTYDWPTLEAEAAAAVLAM